MSEQTTLPKAEAAQFLNVSTRTLDRRADEWGLERLAQRGKHGIETHFAVTELERVKEELTRTPVQVGRPRAGGEQPAEPQALELAPVAGDARAQLLALLTEAVSAGQKAAPAVSLSDKLMLSIPEAATLSGVPVDKLRADAKGGSLKTIKGVGRGLGKVRREDLEHYVRKLR